MDAEHHVGAHVQAAHAGRSCWSILIDDVRAGREQARAGASCASSTSLPVQAPGAVQRVAIKGIVGNIVGMVRTYVAERAQRVHTLSTRTDEFDITQFSRVTAHTDTVGTHQSNGPSGRVST